MTVTSVLWGFRHGGFVSFSVHNAYLHMTNVNTTEDKRITPPPVIMIQDLYCCVGKKSARMCVHLHVSRFCADRRVCVVCVWEKEQRLHLAWATECASMKCFCHSPLPFWSSSEVEWDQAESSKGSNLRQPVMRGAPTWSHSLFYDRVVPRSPEETHTHSSGVWPFSSSIFTFTVSAIQYSVIICGTKRVKTQADFGDKLPGIRSFYPGCSWEKAASTKAKVTSSEGAGWDLDWCTLFSASLTTPYCHQT